MGRYLLPLGSKPYNVGNSLNWKTPGDDHTRGDTWSLQRCIYTGSRKSAGPHHISVFLKAKNLFESRHWNESANIHSVPGLVLSYVHTFFHLDLTTILWCVYFCPQSVLLFSSYIWGNWGTEGEYIYITQLVSGGTWTNEPQPTSDSSKEVYWVETKPRRWVTTGTGSPQTWIQNVPKAKRTSQENKIDQICKNHYACFS